MSELATLENDIHQFWSGLHSGLLESYTDSNISFEYPKLQFHESHRLSKELPCVALNGTTCQDMQPGAFRARDTLFAEWIALNWLFACCLQQEALLPHTLAVTNCSLAAARIERGGSHCRKLALAVTPASNPS